MSQVEDTTPVGDEEPVPVADEAAAEEVVAEEPAAPVGDTDPAETAEWLESLQYALETKGPERVAYLMSKLAIAAHSHGVELPFSATTPYINTIPAEKQPVFPGNREIERRIKSIIRWNAMAMVVRANKVGPDGPGGHISTFASSATLYEIGYNHFFRGKGDGYDGDQVYFQGHASPGMYSRAFVEGRLTEEQLVNFRHELAPGGGLSSYPHPWLMPEFWEFPTVSMGLGPINSIYQARFNKYLADRGLKDTSNQKVWAFLGDGECDEPESLGAITLGSREKLDNLIFVINCNLQRLDGPVRGNGKIIQELEGAFRGAGWNVIKVIWGDDWDALLEKDEDGLLVERMGEVVDGEYQKYVVSGGAYVREHFFGKSPELLEMVSHMSDEKLNSLRRGGHDPEKVYAAYKWAAENKNGKPTVILAKTIKGYGLGEAGEGRNVAHNQKKVNENELIQFRSRFGIPISDEDVVKAPFYKPAEDSPEMKYLRERREALGGPVPIRSKERPKSIIPPNSNFADSFTSSDDREASTTMAFVKHFGRLLKDKNIGKYIVPIVPDESRTFGMESLFTQCGIYSHAGQLYEPVDSDNFLYYKEAKDGQILEEGITEAGSMASFIAAGSAYVTHGINMIPFFIYYSMFGFQRIGDSIWLAQDMKCKGFLMGGTAGRTTLNGEGLQHQDGHSHLIASAFPGIRCYDPAYAYETATIVMDGMREMYERNQEVMYYITIHNENYKMPGMPAGVEEGIIKGMYKVSSVDAGSGAPKVVLFGSGSILRCALGAQQLLAEKYGVSSNVYSVTSYKTLWTEANDCEHWNLLHPGETPKKSYLETILADETGPFISTSDNVRLVGQQIEPWVPGDYYVLGCDGVGRSDRRARLRRHFEVDAECTTLAALTRLAKAGKFDAAKLPQVIKDLGIDPEKGNPVSL